MATRKSMKNNNNNKNYNDFNYDIDRNEKLNDGDKFQICDLYLSVKRNINIIIKIINNFYYYFS